MERRIVDFSRIILSVENPRLDVSFSEEEAISNMISDQKEKLAELAADIVEHGLNPLEFIAVFPSEDYPGFFEVAEGNRRVCALKLLADPSLLSFQHSSLYSKMSQLAENYDVPEQLEVVVFDDEQQIRHWMELRHMGEQGGKGLSKWNSVQKMRFQKKQTGSDALLDFWTWMDAENILTFNQIFAVTKTNWQRILRDAYFPFLKLRYDGKYFVQKKDIPVFSERIREIQRRLAGQTVGIVYDQQRIESFYNDLSRDLYGMPYAQVIENETELPQLKLDSAHSNTVSIEDGTDTPLQGNGKIELNNELPDSSQTQEHTGTIQFVPSKDIFNGCKTIIPFSCSIRSSNMRVNKIIHELKELNPDQYPNACGSLLRTLFELSAKVFLENQTGEDMTEKEFQPAIKAAANQLRNMGRLSNDAHSAIIKDIDSLRSIFNGYMHNTDGYPSSIALKNLFKAHVGFITECLR